MLLRYRSFAWEKKLAILEDTAGVSNLNAFESFNGND